MNSHRDAKVQQILELFNAGEYRVDPAAVAGSVVRRMSVARGNAARSPASRGRGRSLGENRRMRGFVSVDGDRARVVAF